MDVGNMLPHQNFTFENVNEFAIKKYWECESLIPYAVQRYPGV